MISKISILWYIYQHICIHIFIPSSQIFISSVQCLPCSLSYKYFQCVNGISSQLTSCITKYICFSIARRNIRIANLRRDQRQWTVKRNEGDENHVTRIKKSRFEIMSVPCNLALAFLRVLLACPITIYIHIFRLSMIDSRCRNRGYIHIALCKIQHGDRRAMSSCRTNLSSAVFLYFANVKETC